MRRTKFGEERPDLRPRKRFDVGENDFEGGVRDAGLGVSHGRVGVARLGREPIVRRLRDGAAGAAFVETAQGVARCIA